MFTNKTKRFATVALIALAVIAQGCSSDSPTEVSLEDLVAALAIEVGANSDGGGAQAGGNATRQSSFFATEPNESQFNVLGPNLNVFAWPIIQNTPITARWSSSIGGTMNLGWPAGDFPTSIWPDLDVAGGTRFGNTWVVYPAGGDDGDWVAQHTEWIRRPGEQGGTTFPFGVKLEADAPCNDCPIGQFIAGPSRHVTDQPEYRRRTVIQWYRYGDLSPWVWQNGGGGGSGPEPEPVEPGDLEQVVVFIQSFTVSSANGTTISFGEVNAVVDLMTLRGQERQVAAGEVPRGTFNDIRFNVDESQSYVVEGGVVKTLNFAEGTVIVNGPFTVGDGGTTTVRLEFDVDQSLTQNADGSWTMAPVVVITVTTG